MAPDPEKLIQAIELKIATLDINGQQVGQAVAVQVSELIDQAVETLDVIDGLGQRMEDFERVLDDQLDQVRQLNAQLERLAGSIRPQNG